MTETIEIEVDPLDPSALDGIADQIMTGIENGLIEIGEAVARAARANAPRGTGELAASIERAQVSAMVMRVVATAPHADAVESGTSTRPPRPFMVPAVQQEEVRFGLVIADEIKLQIGAL